MTKLHKFRVIAADPITGEDVELVVEALEKIGAEAIARSRGLFISKVIYDPNAELTAERVKESNELSNAFPNYEQYAEYTRLKNWNGIFRINSLSIDSFGTKKELAVLHEYLENGEVVFALVSGIMPQTDTSNLLDFGSNTWLVALTSDRFLFLDHAMLTKSVDTQSIRHNRVQAVSSSQGWVLGKLQIDLGARTVVVDNCDKSGVRTMSNLANKWLNCLDQNHKGQSIQQNSSLSRSAVDDLAKLGALYEAGVLDDEEFKEAKKKLLSDL